MRAFPRLADGQNSGAIRSSYSPEVPNREERPVKPASGAKNKSPQRRDRLAAALRDNLKKRKAKPPSTPPEEAMPREEGDG
jgi:hypothetical protein